MREKWINCIMVIAVCFIVAGCGVSDEDYIDFVKNGSPNVYPDISYGEAFGAYFYDGEWEYFKSTDDEDVVEFTGTILYDEEETEFLVQFVLDYEDGTFETYVIALDGEEQSDAMLSYALSEIFESYIEENGG